MVALPAVCATSAAPYQEGAGLTDTVDLDPPMSPSSLAPTSVMPTPLSEPMTESASISATGPTTLSPAFASVPSMSKSKIRRLRKKGVGVSTFSVEQAKSTLLTFVCNVNGHTARILIDGGAQGNVISSSFVKRHNIPLHSSPPIPIILPDGSQSFSAHTANISLQRQQYSTTLDPIVYPLKKYDILLGKPWLTQTNPLINWRTNNLRLHHNGIDIDWDCTGFQSSSISTRTRGLLLSHIHFYTEATTLGSEIYLALIRSNNNDQPSSDHQQPSITTIPPRPPPSLPPDIHTIVHDEFPDVFPSSLPSGLPPDRGDAMRIETDPMADPPFKPVIRLSIAELDELKKQLDDLLAKKLIKPSTSPYGAPVLFVKKSDGSLRMCVDYRGLNRITRKNRHPLPRIDELIDRFRGAKYFTKLDLISGYHQQRIYEPHTHKTAFRCRYGHFEFNVVPFGLTNAPASFSNMMLKVLDPVLDKCVVVYLDDILIYSQNKADHLRHIRSVLALLRKHGLFVKLSKCSFMQEETEFLGHVISKDGIHTNAGLVRAIREWPRPGKQKHVQQFIGLAQFYQQYIHNFAQIALPLTALLGEGRQFVWDDTTEAAFLALKKAISTAPVLRIFDPDLLSTVETDASGFAVGAVLFQTDSNGVSRPVAFTSRKLNSAEKNYPTHEQELLAVVHALKTWRYYLDGSHFIVYTDHDTLRHFPTQPRLTRRQARWMELLQEYDFDFKFKRGVDNIVPDALSRRPDYQESSSPPMSINSLDLQSDPGLRQRLINGYLEDSRLASIYQSCLRGKSPTSYSLNDGLLYVERHGDTLLCIPQSSDLRLLLLHDVHDAAIAGHLGFDKTYAALRRFAFWPRMSVDTRRYVESCSSCQRNKAVRRLPAGLLRPLAIPEQRWDTVSMDFVVKLPMTARKFDAITVFVDKLSKQVHFAPSRTTDSAIDVANCFFSNVFRLHGLPGTIVSDRDTKFTSTFWRRIQERLGTKLAMSSSFHPQTDGQSERAIQTLKTMLRSLVNHKQDDWDLYLPAAEFAYNNAVHSSTGVSPFFLNHGFHPRVPASLLSPATSAPVSDFDSFVSAQQSALAVARDSLLEAQEQQAKHADAHRRPHSYKVGDQVLLNTEHITTAYDSTRPAASLQARFFGPFTLLQQRSPVSFQVELPATMRIHDVFHVDRFKPFIPSPESLGRRSLPPPEPEIVNGEAEYEVESILAHRTRRRRTEFLIKWVGYDEAKDSTWEPLQSITNSPVILRKYCQEHGLFHLLGEGVTVS
jgi:transposase InsO family protein